MTPSAEGTPSPAEAPRNGTGPRIWAGPRIWGIVNVTPDSFSDGGLHDATDTAVAHARTLLAEGAQVLDIGGESTRPGATPVTPEAEAARVVPVIRALAVDVPPAQISVDTRRAAVAREALAAGAGLVNDVSAARDPDMLPTVADAGAGLVLMHMQGTPRTMQAEPHYTDVVAEVGTFLADAARRAEAAGIPRTHLWLDPGIGFGKTLAHNLALLQGMAELRQVAPDVAWMLGASRKSFLGTLTGRSVPRERVAASLACALAASDAGWDAVRVHDVAATRDALRTWHALRRPAPVAPR